MLDALSAEREDGAAPPDDGFTAAVRAAKRRCRARPAILATCDRDRAVGCTVSAFLSLSLRPPSLLVSLRHDSGTLGHIRASTAFGLSILSERQAPLVRRFALGRPDERFDGTAFVLSHGVPLVVGAAAAFACGLTAELVVHDRVLLAGDILAVRAQPPDGVAPVLTDRDAGRPGSRP